MTQRLSFPDLIFTPDPCGAAGVLAMMRNRLDSAGASGAQPGRWLGTLRALPCCPGFVRVTCSDHQASRRGCRG
jgi:hypothetical protein